MTFNLRLSSDGMPKEYGNVSNASLEEMIEELIYYNPISKKYDEDELHKILTEMKPGFENYKMFGDRYQEFKVIKNK